MVHEITSTIDWCEENWVYHSEVAEWWNTTSALAYCGFAFWIMFATPSRLMPNRKCALVSKIHGFNILMVGLGTIWFHGRLTYEGQMFDEIWMLIMNTYIALALMMDEFPKGTFVVFLALLAYSYIHVQVGFVRIFQIAYTISSTALFYGIWRHVEIEKVVKKSKAWNGERRRNFYTSFARILVLLIVAMLCWSSDQFFCKSYETHALINPQLHAIFHLLSSLVLKGTHLIILIALSPEDVARIEFTCGIIPYAKIMDKTGTDSDAKTKGA